MKIKRALLIGMVIWIIAILFYSVSYSIPIMENRETQANLVLFVVVIPLVWLGCTFYYKTNLQTHGYLVGQTMLLTADQCHYSRNWKVG